METIIYEKFHQEAKKGADCKIRDDDWLLLQKEIDKCYDRFTARLNAIHPLSDIDLRICLLLKIKIAVYDMPNLIGRRLSTISMARKKLYKIFMGKEDKPEMFDKFIAEF